jgi:lysophospholipase L1-like esterase
MWGAGGGNDRETIGGVIRLAKWGDWLAVGGLGAVLLAVLAAGEIHQRQVQQAQLTAAKQYLESSNANGTNAGGAGGGPAGNGSNGTPSGTTTSPAGATSPSDTGTASAGGTAGHAANSLIGFLMARAENQGGAGGAGGAGGTNTTGTSDGSGTTGSDGTAPAAVHIVAFGSSGTKGVGVANPADAWFPQLVTQLSTQPGLHGLTGDDLGISAGSSAAMLQASVVDEAIQQRPDLILVETCAMADWAQSVPMATHLENLDQLANTLRGSLPNVRVVFLSSNPIQADSKNRVGLTYADYLQRERSHLQAEGYLYIDVEGAIRKALQEKHETVANILADTYHPNAEGYRLWYQAVWDGLSRG